MLSRLSISNYALIEHLDFCPGSGLSIITGETGAGKSVMLGALALLKGERADMKVIADKSNKAVVEASFEDIEHRVSEKILEIDPEWEGGELIIRREIYPSGRSRAFINDSPVNLSQLDELSKSLFDIHSQNSNSLLSDPQIQLLLIDSVAGNEDEMAAYIAEFRKYVELRQKISRLKEELQKNREQTEIISFRLGQLDKLKPKSGELKKVESRYETLSRAEEVRGLLATAMQSLGSENAGAIDKIEEARGALSGIDFTLWEEKDPDIANRLYQCVVELKDITETIEDAESMMDYEPSTLSNLSARMADYYNAFKLFKVESDTALEELHCRLKLQFSQIENGDYDTANAEKEAKAAARKLKEMAGKISEKRKKAAVLLQEKVESSAKKLGLDNLRFEINITDARLSKTGGDSIKFLASFNKSSQMAPVGEIASGGEMARLMLALKKITATHLKLPTIVFDEIDTGVSGHIADRMGKMMQEMGEKMQILTITHLPQVAVKGEKHYKVYKEDRGEKTVSDVMLLSPSQREEEIGRMLAGEEINEAALTNARSLLKKKI